MPPWALAWFIGVYLSVLICIIGMIRFGIQSASWWEGFKQFLIFAGFAVGEWFLESWANARAPFYSYPQNIFPDMLPHFPFSASVATPEVLEHLCVQAPSPAVSATIPLAGAVIVYSLMWTARLLLGGKYFAPLHPVLIPFMVGVAALFLDLYLDPALASAFECDNAVFHTGLGFWHWFGDASLGDFWFGIPLYNFAVWYSAPAFLASIAILIAGFVYATTAQDMVIRGVIVMTFGLILYTSPNAHAAYAQMIAVFLTIIASLRYIILNWPSYKRDNPFRYETLLPLLFVFLYPLAAILFASTVPLTASLLGAGVIFAALGLLFIFSPYVKFP